jgi:hypothetical protein
MFYDDSGPRPGCGMAGPLSIEHRWECLLQEDLRHLMELENGPREFPDPQIKPHNRTFSFFRQERGSKLKEGKPGNTSH